MSVYSFVLKFVFLGGFELASCSFGISEDY